MPTYSGQLHDQTKVGNSQLTESEIGCFNYSFSNLLAKPQINIAVSADALNAFFTQHNLYTYDAVDKANDDLYWNTITSYCPQLVANQPYGGAGFPASDQAIVKFYYQSVQHPWLDAAKTKKNMVTHFCAVNSAADHSIIDSWDGLVKTPAEYQHVYGTPVAYATYAYHAPATIPTSLPPSAPISAPLAAAPTPQPPAPTAPTHILMPKTDRYYLWHVYREGGPYTLDHAIGALDPYHYGPLMYQILGNPAPHIFIIQTESFGRVAIYAGPDTVAQFPGGGHGEGEDTTFVPDPPVTPAPGVEVSEIVPAPSTTPVAPAVTYARFDEPMQLVTKEGAQSMNFISGTIVDSFETGTPFEAVGKATLANNDTYYMNQVNFGNADKTQQTPITVGIKTISLAAAPAVADPAPATDSSATEAASENEGQVQVRVIPTKTNSWKDSISLLPAPVLRYTNRDLTVYDFATGIDKVKIPEGTPVTVGATFNYQDNEYYRSQSSIEKGTWYGFPLDSLDDDIEHEMRSAVEAAHAASHPSWVDNLRIKRSK